MREETDVHLAWLMLFVVWFFVISMDINKCSTALEDINETLKQLTPKIANIDEGDSDGN